VLPCKATTPEINSRARAAVMREIRMEENTGTIAEQTVKEKREHGDERESTVVREKRKEDTMVREREDEMGT